MSQYFCIVEIVKLKAYLSRGSTLYMPEKVVFWILVHRLEKNLDYIYIPQIFYKANEIPVWILISLIGNSNQFPEFPLLSIR